MKVSFIIPLFGQWDLTKKCLLSLKNEVQVPYEIILINNGAKVLENDETDREIHSFISENFNNIKYLPQEKNLNFAAASNLGAREAKSSLLFFLNNDTIVMTGFLEPLLQEIDKDNSLKIVSSFLLYPTNSFDIHTIQHMGISFSPTKKLLHIYEDFPENHRVTRRPKPIQAVTAAAFLIRKEHFLSLDSGFNEEFRNGFEDIEFCARFNKMGGIYKIINQSRIVHYCSQSAGRRDFDSYNANLLNTLGTANSFKPDWHTILENDGYELKLSKWLSFIPSLSEKHSKSLEKHIINNDLDILKKEFHKEHYWHEGLIAIINHKDATIEDKWHYFEFGQKFNKDLIFENLDVINKTTDNIISYMLEQEQFQEDYSVTRLKKLQDLKILLKPISASLYLQCTKLIDTHENFINNEYNEIKNRLIGYLK